MKEKVKLNISARHVHLTEESINILFGHDLTVRNYLNQKGYYAAEETVTLKTSEGIMENVRVIGPARTYNQAEIPASDARKLKINPPVRKSGDIEGSAEITIMTDKGEVTGNFGIIIDRHVHMNFEDAKRLNVENDEVLKLEISGEKPGVIDVDVKVSEDGYFEVHLDTDDANAFLINTGDEGILYKSK